MLDIYIIKAKSGSTMNTRIKGLYPHKDHGSSHYATLLGEFLNHGGKDCQNNSLTERVTHE
jgi:hypothetical protein